MCTVSYFPFENGYIMTSNRDEKISRKASSKPVKKEVGNHIIWFPQDMDAMGTWFGSKSNGITYILFNGAEKKHLHQPPYRKSRGIILMELMEGADHMVAWQELDLHEIEPFSVVIGGPSFLHLFRWNGEKKSHEMLDAAASHIWSSATLYSPAAASQRETWFNEFVSNSDRGKNAESIFNFHHTEKGEDKENGLVINREGFTLTKSITQTVHAGNSLTLKHFDLLSNDVSIITQEVI